MDPRRILRRLTYAAALALLAVLAWRFIHETRRAGGSAAPVAFGPAPEFRLTERSGASVGLSDLRGKIWVADFIFTRCGGPCPLLSREMARLQSEFDSPRLRFVSFSVDPAHDTPPVLARYADRFAADPHRWLFLTGEPEAVYETIVKGFHLAAQENPSPDKKPGEEVVHSLDFALVDAEGRIRGYYNGADAEALDRLRRDIRRLL